MHSNVKLRHGRRPTLQGQPSVIAGQPLLNCYGARGHRTVFMYQNNVFQQLKRAIAKLHVPFLIVMNFDSLAPRRPLD